MKYLKLKIENAVVITELNLKKNTLKSNKILHPMNARNIYNSICCLFNRRPTPQFRSSANIQKFMPIHKDIEDAVNDGFIILQLISKENITTVKKNWDSNSEKCVQTSWKDCDYVIYKSKFESRKDLQLEFQKIIDLTPKEQDDIGFENTIKKIQSLKIGTNIIQKKQKLKNVIKTKSNKKSNKKQNVPNDIIEYLYNTDIDNFILYLRKNNATPIGNIIKNIQIPTKPSQFGKRVFRGNVETKKYRGFMYIPLTNELEKELKMYGKGFSNILDGGLVTIESYGEIEMCDLVNYTKISGLNNTMKYQDVNNIGILDWTTSLYNVLLPTCTNPQKTITDIFNKAGLVLGEDYTNEKLNMYIQKLNDLKPTDTEKEIGIGLNKFIEKCLDERYNKIII